MVWLIGAATLVAESTLVALIMAEADAYRHQPRFGQADPPPAGAGAARAKLLFGVKI